MAERATPLAVCPRDGAPLISTCAFRKAEFYCLGCGGRFGFLDPRAAEPTAELTARYESLKAEWDEHVEGKLIPAAAWLERCEKCVPGRETHEVHATAAEVDAHEAALAWLKERASRHVEAEADGG